MTGNQHEFEQFAREKLDETVEKLDSTSAVKLAAMRRKALGASNGRSPIWIPSALLGVAMVAVLMIWVIPHERPDGSFDVASEDVEIFTSETDFELLEDMEFYQWLEQNNGMG